MIFSAVALAAAWLGHLAGLTFEFGAFVAGAVTSEAAGSRMVASVVQPFRQLFVMVFFVSMGTLLDVATAAVHWEAVLILAVAAVAVRWALWSAVARAVAGAAAVTSLGLSMLPMGEFNIVPGTPDMRPDAWIAPKWLCSSAAPC